MEPIAVDHFGLWRYWYLYIPFTLKNGVALLGASEWHA